MAVLIDEAEKAVTSGTGTDMVHFSFPIGKKRDTETVNPVDGTPDIEIWGKVTDGTLDSDLQIVDPEASLRWIKTWYDTKANVRLGHDPKRPIGKGIEVDGHYVKALIAEPTAKHLIRRGILQDWSVGIINPDIRKNDPRFRHLDPMGKAINGVVTDRPDGLTELGEISAVDRGSNYGTAFAMMKAATGGEWVGELTAPDDVLAGAAPAKVYKTVSVDLPKSARIRMSPADLAKMNTMARRAVVPEVTKAAGPDAAAAPDMAFTVTAMDADESASLTAKNAEAGIYKRDIDAATRRRLAGQGRALPDLSYPVETHEDADNAATLALSGHGNVSAAKKLIRRIARKEGWTDILDRLGGKGGRKKVTQPAAAKAAACACEGSGLIAETPCTSCPKGRKRAKALVRKALAGLDVASVTADAAEKKQKVMCGHCGAKQNAKHVHCPECGGALRPGAMPVRKNHEYACLGCGKDPLDKGEQHCPQCGRENPGYLPEADSRIPANRDAAKGAAKERVDPDASVTKAKSKPKAKKGGKGKKGKPFGDNQAKPFGAKDDDAGDAKKAAAVVKRKGGKKGKGRSPAIGDVAQDTTGLPAHREPDGPPVEAFEADLGAGDGDAEMKAAMRVKALGIDPGLAAVHDLTCPAFRPADVTKAMPWASFATIDTESWQLAALNAASGADMVTAMAEWNKAAELSRCAVTLKTADPQLLHDLRLQQNAAFAQANADILKTFRDATPGPGSFPTPSHPMSQQFRRPYVSAGHAAPSPQHDGARSFPVTEGTPVAADYQRGFLTAGHAADSPQNSTPRHMPQPAPVEAGRPEAMHYQGTMADNARQSLVAMHDHVAHRFPDICPMSPNMGDTQKPGHPVPEAVGGPVAGKTSRASARKARARMAATRRKLERKVLKGTITVEAAQAKLGITPAVTKAAAPVAAPGPAAPAIDAEAITAAVKAATAPLLKRQRAQDRALRRLAKVTDAIASSPDTSAAPFRGAGVAKSATTSPALAGPVTAAQSAEQAQTAHLQRLHHEWRNSYDPQMREAAYRELTAHLGISPMTSDTGPTPYRPPMT